MASPGKDTDRMKSYKNKALNPQEMRRRREEEGIQLRKQKREEQVKHLNGKNCPWSKWMYMIMTFHPFLTHEGCRLTHIMSLLVPQLFKRRNVCVPSGDESMLECPIQDPDVSSTVPVSGVCLIFYVI